MLTLVGASMNFGCGAPNESSEREQDIATMEDALYAGCATVTADDDIYSSYCGSEWSDSPDTSYGHGSSCPDRWVVEFTGALDYTAFGNSGWADTIPTNETLCENSHWVANGYKYNGSTWTDLDWVKYSGSWSAGTCTFVLTYDCRDDPGDGNTKFRVATKAYLHTGFGDAKRKARSHVTGTSCFGG